MLRSRWIGYTFVLWTLCLVGLAWPQADTIGPGDRLQVTCKEEGRLNGTYEVTRDGLVLLPYVGAVRVGGASEVEAGDRIAKALVLQRIVKSATVRVAKLAVASGPFPPTTPQPPPKPPIRISGSVKTPSEIAWTEELRLGDVLRQTEPTADADLARVRIVSVLGISRTVNMSRAEGAPPADDPRLQPGDRVFVPIKPRVPDATHSPVPTPAPNQPEAAPQNARGGVPLGDPPTPTAPDLRPKTLEPGLAPYPPTTQPQVPPESQPVAEPKAGATPNQPSQTAITVSGAVAKPGPVAFRPGLTLSEAIRCAGGPMGSAKLDQVVLVRGRNQYSCDLDLVKRGLASDCELRPGDEIVVPRGKSHPVKDTRRTYAAGLAVLYFLFGR